jgi:hypothetical protein
MVELQHQRSDWKRLVEVQAVLHLLDGTREAAEQAQLLCIVLRIEAHRRFSYGLTHITQGNACCFLHVVAVEQHRR